MFSTENISDLDYSTMKKLRLLFWGLLLTTFEVRSILRVSWGRSEHWLEPKTKPANQPKLILIPDTHGTTLFVTSNGTVSERGAFWCCLPEKG